MPLTPAPFTDTWVKNRCWRSLFILASPPQEERFSYFGVVHMECKECSLCKIPPFTHTHTHTHACVHTHTHTHTQSHACTHTHMHLCTHTHACTNMHAQTHTHTLTHMHTHTLTHTHTHYHSLKHCLMHSGRGNLSTSSVFFRLFFTTDKHLSCRDRY